MTLTDGLEAYIAVILTIEFGYDYWYNTRENRIKRRKREKAKMDKQGLREGTSLSVQKTKGEMCDMPEASVSIQKKAES